MAALQAFERIKNRFTPKILGIVPDECVCPDERLIVREALPLVLASAKMGFVLARCQACGRNWVVGLKNGDRRRIVGK